MNVLYTATATATGGRQGKVLSDDGVLQHLDARAELQLVARQSLLLHSSPRRDP